MSRIRIFLMLFIALLLGTGATAGLYRYWVQSYHEQVSEPDMQQRIKTANAAIQLFAYHKTELAKEHLAKADKLLDAFAKNDKKKRGNLVHDELNVLHNINKDLKTAAFIAAIDMKGLGFVRADNPNWTSDWKSIRPIQQALKGSPSHGFVTLKKKPYLLLSLPIIQKENGKKDEVKPKAAPPKCKRANRYWYCWTRCIKRKNRKCIKRAPVTPKTRCYCRRMNAKQIAQKKKEQEEKEKARLLALEAKKKAAKGKRSNQIGVVALAFELDDRLAIAIKKMQGIDVAFTSKEGTVLGSTLHGNRRDALVKQIAKQNKAPKKSKVEKVWSARLEGKSFIALSSAIPRIAPVKMVLLKSLTLTNRLFRMYMVWGAAIGGIVFLLSLVLIFPGINRFRRDLEVIEDGILDTYSTGNLQVVFRQDSAWILGALATSLNKLYGQLRGDPELGDELQRSGEWDLEGLDANINGVVPQGPTQPMTPQEPAPAPAPAPAPEPVQEETSDESEGLNMEWIDAILENPQEHYEEVYDRYRQAKVDVGEDVSRLKKDRFVEKLYKNAASCMTSYDNCRGVLFDVTIKDNKVILKPQLIPKD